jgi:hypothetical protein
VRLEGDGERAMGGRSEGRRRRCGDGTLAAAKHLMKNNHYARNCFIVNLNFLFY